MSQGNNEHIGRRVSPRPFVVAACSLLAAAGTASAADCDGDGTDDADQTFIWRLGTPGVGSWTEPNNWLSPFGGVPVLDDLAVFDGNNTFALPPYDVFLPTPIQVRGLNVIDAEMSIDLLGNTLKVSGNLPGCRELLIGGQAGSALSILGQGTLETSLLRIGDQPGSSSTLSLAALPSTLDLVHISPAPVVVGESGDGTLELVSASFIHDGALEVGANPGVEGTIIAWNQSSVLLGSEAVANAVIGALGTGIVTIRDAATWQHGVNVSLTLGQWPGGEGQLNVFTPGVSHTMPVSSFVVGMNGDGLLRIAQGSDIDMPASGPVVLGESADAFGEARIIEGGSWQVTGQPIALAPGGAAELNLGETGQVSSQLGVIADHDGVVGGSGGLLGDLTLRGGAIAPNDRFDETGGRQQLTIGGDLDFLGSNADTGLVETGRMIFTLDSDDPAQSMSAVVTNTARLDGTLQVRLAAGIEPMLEQLYPVIEADSLEGVFDAVQTQFSDSDLIASPVYPGDNTVYVEFLPADALETDLQSPAQFVVPGAFTDAKVEDINNDGFPDLVAVSDNPFGAPDQVVVALNLGAALDGTWFGFDQTVSFYNSGGEAPVSVEIGDMNEDGAPDIVVAHRDSPANQIRILRNNAANPGDFPAFDPRSVTINGTPIDLTLADIGDDGLLDILTIYDQFFRGSGGGINTAQDDDSGGFDDSDGDTGDDPGSIDTMGGEADPNGVAVTSKTEGNVYTYGFGAARVGGAARGGGVFPLFQTGIYPTGRDPRDMYTADLSGDGLDEIVSSDTRSGSISVLRALDLGPGETFYDDAVTLRASDAAAGGQPTQVIMMDANGDGLNDIVYIASDDQGQRRVHAIRNLGSDDPSGALRFSRARVITGDDGTGPTPTILAAADLNGDGRDDLVAVSGVQEIGPTVSAYLATNPGPCNAADVAFPFGVLDLQDVQAFIDAFVNQNPLADLAPPAGVFDLADVSVFITAFVGGCP